MLISVMRDMISCEEFFGLDADAVAAHGEDAWVADVTVFNGPADEDEDLVECDNCGTRQSDLHDAVRRRGPGRRRGAGRRVGRRTAAGMPRPPPVRSRASSRRRGRRWARRRRG